MGENLKTTKYNDNTPIANVTDSLAWLNLNTAAYSWYRNNIKNKDKFGALYNWYAVGTGKLCPSGWHVASDADYNELEVYLGLKPSDVNVWGWRGTGVGTKLKSTAGWADGGNGTNSSGLAIVAAGYRQYVHGDFIGAGLLTYLWSSTDDSKNGNTGVAWYRRLDTNNNAVYKATTSKKGGKYVRCIRDVAAAASSKQGSR
jgi:uncharacterized protein (TIGR02145 family)